MADIKVAYEEKQGRQMIAACGVIGGLSPDQCSVIAHLYTDYAGTPSISTHQIHEDGSIDPSLRDHIRRADVVREVQATLVLSPEAAVRVGECLREWGRQALEARRGNEPWSP